MNQSIFLLKILFLAVIISSCNAPEKTAYVTTGKLFDSYKGTKELNNKLTIQESRFKLVLDSLKLEIEICRSKNSALNNDCIVLEKKFKETYTSMVQFNKEYSVSEKDKIWVQLNTHIESFGKDKGYKYILGANGSGNIMYADSSYDITNEVVEFANLKYDGK